MLAILGGTLALLCGVAVLVLPLLLPELSRPRDSAWGAVVLLLGLVLVTSAERLTGAPMLGVLCGGMLIGRLSLEVGQGRWRQLSMEEQQRLVSAERWQTALGELAASASRLGGVLGGIAPLLGQWLQARRGSKSSGKRWVRPEPASEESGTPTEPCSAEDAAPAAVVASFAELEVLIDASLTPSAPSEASPAPQHESAAAAPATAAPATMEPGADPVESQPGSSEAG